MLMITTIPFNARSSRAVCSAAGSRPWRYRCVILKGGHAAIQWETSRPRNVPAFQNMESQNKQIPFPNEFFLTLPEYGRAKPHPTQRAVRQQEDPTNTCDAEDPLPLHNAVPQTSETTGEATMSNPRKTQEPTSPENDIPSLAGGQTKVASMQH
jgi:hypothetical protein